MLELGTNLLRLRGAVTSAAQVPEVEVRGWDVAQKGAVVGTAPAAHHQRESGTTRPAGRRTFGGRP